MRNCAANGRGHTSDVRGKGCAGGDGGVGARVDVGEDATVQALALKTEVTGDYADGLGRMGDGAFAW